MKNLQTDLLKINRYDYPTELLTVKDIKQIFDAHCINSDEIAFTMLVDGKLKTGRLTGATKQQKIGQQPYLILHVEE